MNLKDRRILSALDMNSRQSYVQIAKAAGISPETARYRVMSLLNDKTILHSMAVINSVMLGNSVYELYIKLRKMTTKIKSSLIAHLKETSSVAWVGEFDGAYDIGIILIVKSPLELREFLEGLTQKFGAIIMKKTVSVNLKVEFMPRDYILGKPRTESKSKTYQVRRDANVTLDEQDTVICRELAKNSRISIQELSGKIALSADAIALRIKDLLKRQVITGYTIVLNNRKIGQSHYKILLYLSDHSTKSVSTIAEASRRNNRTLAIVQTLSEWDFEIDLEVDNYEQLRSFLDNLTNQCADQIRDYDLLRIIDMPKYNFFP